MKAESKKSGYRFVGFRDNLIKLLTDHPADSFTPKRIANEHFGEVPITTINYHLQQLAKIRVFERTDEGYKLASPTHRAGPKAELANVIEAASSTFRVVPPLSSPSRAFIKRQVDSIVLRMQNANEVTDLFTALDFDIMRKLVS